MGVCTQKTPQKTPKNSWAPFYPSWPKSAVNSSSFFRSALFTLDLDVDNAINISVCKKKTNLVLYMYQTVKIIPTIPVNNVCQIFACFCRTKWIKIKLDVMVSLFDLTNHWYSRLQKLISIHICPCHFHGPRGSRRTRGQKVIYYYTGVVSWLTLNLNKQMNLKVVDYLAHQQNKSV